jgi:hypothetical protein
MLTKIETCMDQKWSADQTLGITALDHGFSPSILDLKISFDYQIIILTNFFVSKRPAQIKRFVMSEC